MSSSKGSVARFRVCLIARDEPGPTGTARYVDRLQRGLELEGLEVIRLVTRPTGLQARLLRVAGTRPGFDPLTFLSAYPVRLSWPDADVYHFTVHTYASTLALARPPGASVATVHDLGPRLESGWGPAGPRRLVSRAAHRLALRGTKRCDAAIAVSGWTRRTLLDAGFATDRVSVVPLGVDHDRYHPFAVPSAFRERYGLPGDRRYLLYVGSEAPRKNLPAVWRALAMVLRRFPNVLLLKVGRGYDPAARLGLGRLAAELGIDSAIRYLDDVPEVDLPSFYNLAEALLMPSLYEGFGLPALEAMASGTPVVVSDRGSLPELVGDDGAIVVQMPVVDSIAAAVIQLLESPDLAAALGARGQARSRQFTWEATARETIEVYRRAVAARRSDPRTG